MDVTRALVFVAAAASAGCGAFLTQEDGEAYRKELSTLKAENKKLERRVAELSASRREDQEKLDKALDDATKLLARNSADLGLTVQKNQTDVATLTGRVDDITTQLNSLGKSFNDYRAASDTKIEQLVNASTTAKAPPIPEKPDDVFAEGKKRYDAKQWGDARRVFDAFINRYPTDGRAAKAQFMIGDTYLKESKYANAINAFLKVIEGYPKAEEVPDAMYEAGEAFYQLKYCGDARVYFQELIKRYPKSEWKKDAAQKLKDLQRDVKNKAVCQQ